MDIPRQDAARRRRRRRILYAVVITAIVAGGFVFTSRLEPAAPTVERATVWIDTVKRGEMLRQVRGNGTLVPEEIRWIPAETEGRVERIFLQPGAVVKPDTVLVELSNPEVEQAAFDAQWQLKAAEAEYRNLRVQLESQVLNQRAVAASVEADFQTAKLQAERNEKLAREGLVSELDLRLSQVRAETLATRHKIEQQRLQKMAESAEAQLAVRRARLEQLRALFALRRRQLHSLRVRPGIAGVLQQVSVEVGQRVTPGTTLAIVARPEPLKAELRIPETQAKDVQIGQSVTVDTRNGIVPGRVVRIDPAVKEGVVTVDVALIGPLPKGARPDLSVDGTILIERLEDVLYVGRPAYGQANSTIGLFRLDPDTDCAVRVPVTLGRSSVNTIEILEGLREGDRVILSDMSQWDGYDRICLK